MSALRDILALSASVLTDANRELHSRTRSERRHRIGARNFGNADRHRRTRPDTSPISLFYDRTGCNFVSDRSSATEIAFAAAPPDGRRSMCLIIKRSSIIRHKFARERPYGVGTRLWNIIKPMIFIANFTITDLVEALYTMAYALLRGTARSMVKGT
jgi:hypothetical protein